MLRLILILSLYLAPANHSGGVKDTCIIDEPDYKGYIMPLKAYPLQKYEKGSVFYKPSRTEVFKAEKVLQDHFDSLCKNANSNNNYDCAVVKESFKNYFRQYVACIHKKNKHKYLYINCVSPQLHRSVVSLRKEWEMILDGGAILFHVKIDLNSGKVDFYDNGFG